MAPTRLNKLQLRTLALLQELAEQSDMASANEETGEVTLFQMPHAHGDHVHVGRFSVSNRFASGLSNANVWAALERKGLARANWPQSITITAEGLAVKTGVREDMLVESDH
ncbi:hypothetical protein JCM17844_18140 [Iodidimonas gelatinilytica]|uniref:Uncharacterized protein n=1 Tax=Iodidimonas gelatinilytica TaxID=1236966 RepID=A0A5A7MQJ6_9PROT|nr:hypothetical protein [Iodidimonas gelatinilytica]GEQ98177.1 hypothetical protein JCM17844_18140 [Iodidimonas gelatinilytica]GER00664.1 hypothetical protein JCM17845_12870 [Iodidimonas gelatinilytica]